jgi:hypothetical protein
MSGWSRRERHDEPARFVLTMDEYLRRGFELTADGDEVFIRGCSRFSH